MKFWVVCQNCGHKEKKELIPSEEAVRERIPSSPPRCEKCKSGNVRTEKVI